MDELLPVFDDFSEVFSAVREYDEKASPITVRREMVESNRLKRWESNTTKGYCQVEIVGGEYHEPFTITPTPALLEYMRTAMILVDNDTLFFKFYVYPAGDGRVYVSYGQIIGSRLLCAVTPEQVQVFLNYRGTKS